MVQYYLIFFFHDTATTEIYTYAHTLSLHDALPISPGSPVESFTLEISPAPPSGVTQKTATGNSLVWDGLENGTAYQVRVQAHNRAPEPSSRSGYSARDTPAAPPAAPAAPTPPRRHPVYSQAHMPCSWHPPHPPCYPPTRIPHT